MAKININYFLPLLFGKAQIYVQFIELLLEINTIDDNRLLLFGIDRLSMVLFLIIRSSDFTCHLAAHFLIVRQRTSSIVPNLIDEQIKAFE